VADESLAPVPAEFDVAPPVAVAWATRDPESPWCPASLHDLVAQSLCSATEREPATQEFSVHDWQILGASVRGRSHAHRGEFRDDAFACASSGDLIVLAVADGAGSASLSRIGAAVTADLAVKRTIARFADSAHAGNVVSQLGTAMALAVHDASLRLHELAAAANEPPSAFRTTLLLVALLGDLMLVSQVGDGVVLVQRNDGKVERVGAPRESAWAGEVNCFIPDACASAQAASLRQLHVPDLALIALMTDGIDDPFHPLEQSGAALVQQWRAGTEESIGTTRQPLMGPAIRSADALVQWLSFEQRGEVDDRTLLFAYRNFRAEA
jgi:Protein phosphatase 2C